MRCGRRTQFFRLKAEATVRGSWLPPLGGSLLAALWLTTAGASAHSLTLVHQQRYCMGTMFDIVVYYPSRPAAEEAIERALNEVARLDRVLSHFKADSELARLVRDGRRDFVSVDPSLYEVIDQSLLYSRRSNGTFDVTIAPVLRVWKQAYNDGRRPSAAEIAAARKCVGYEKIDIAAPDRIRLRSDCLDIDLGGIGKGYAVDRALAVLQAAGIRDALVNAGSSSIAAIGAPPGLDGWPVAIGATVSGRDTMLLRNASISTSQQNAAFLPFVSATFGDIIDPRAAAPVEGKAIVSVIAPRATASDALSTTLLLLPPSDGAALLSQFDHVSALWISTQGELQSAYGVSDLQLSESR
jgi:thiamine biosynthesis lipoprotein